MWAHLENIEWNSLIDDLKEQHAGYEQPLRLDMTKRIDPSELPYVSPSTKVYTIEGKKNWFIIATPSGIKIACQPHIVGEELQRHMIYNAEETVKTIYSMFYPKDKLPKTLVEHVLRASLGYEIHTALKNLIRDGIREVEIRPKYLDESYRSHDGILEGNIEVVHRDFRAIERDTHYDAMYVLDTIATAKSVIVSIQEGKQELDKAGSTVDKAFVGGFASMEGMEKIERVTRELGMDLVAILYVAGTGLCDNGYDMPFFGPDQRFFEKTGKTEMIGSVIDRETLMECLQGRYIGGMDTVGNWSDRQRKLWNGKFYESVPLTEHIGHSIEFISGLQKMPHEQWQEENMQRESQALRRAYAKELPNDLIIATQQAQSVRNRL